MPPTFIFIRHGQAEHNVAAEQYGNSAYSDPYYRDAKLTDLGHKQTLEVGKEIIKIADRRPLHIFSSPLTRCIQTAENILQNGAKPLVLQLHDSLLERLHAGHQCNERKTPLEIQQAFPRWNTSLLPTFPPHWSPIGESYESVRIRMTSFVEYLKKIYKGSHTIVVIVSHHDALESLLQKRLANAEFVEMYY